MMKAIQIQKFGAPNVLKLVEVGVPKASGTKILVKVISAGVNPVDTYIREGAFMNLPELPFTLGKDGAGIVHAVGENVRDFQVGQRVFVCGRNLGKYGTYAEYTLADERDVFPLAEKLSFDQGAALGIPYFTAYRALCTKAMCVPGECVLIHGSSGAVGLACIELAKKKHLKVIGTAGTEAGLNLVKKKGADYAVCHRNKDYMKKIMEITENKGVDIVVEMLANVNLENDLDVLANKGRILVVGSRGAIKIDPRKMMAPETEITGVALMSSTEVIIII